MGNDSSSYSVETAAQSPCPLLLVSVVGTDSANAPVQFQFARHFEDWFETSYDNPEHLEYRCVDYERLLCVLATGCDVEPFHAPFFAAGSLSKAIKYGHGSFRPWHDKVLLIFDSTKLEKSWREVQRSIPENELIELKNDYPNEWRTEDGHHLLLSRFEEEATWPAAYEMEYGKWIPHDPWGALCGVVILGAKIEDLMMKLCAIVLKDPSVKLRWDFEGATKAILNQLQGTQGE